MRPRARIPYTEKVEIENLIIKKLYNISNSDYLFQWEIVKEVMQEMNIREKKHVVNAINRLIKRRSVLNLKIHNYRTLQLSGSFRSWLDVNPYYKKED